VPKEVGKVGTESAKFIQPVAQREDGIKAMFAKQTSKAAPAMKSSKHPETGSSRSPKGKRKRKGNEKQHNDLEDEDDRPKESKLVKIDSWEDSDVVEYTDNKPEEVSEQTLS
jgi:hypothetical protein